MGPTSARHGRAKCGAGETAPLERDDSWSDLLVLSSPQKRGARAPRPGGPRFRGDDSGQCAPPIGCPARGAAPGSARPAPPRSMVAGASRPPSGRALPSSLRSGDEDVQLNPAEHRGAGNGRSTSSIRVQRPSDAGPEYGRQPELRPGGRFSGGVRNWKRSGPKAAVVSEADIQAWPLDSFERWQLNQSNQVAVEISSPSAF